MYDTSSLYPIVHDLTEAEDSPCSSPLPFCGVGPCGGMVCFSLNELVVASDNPLPLVPLDSLTIGRRESTNDSDYNSIESHATEQPAEHPTDPVSAPPPPARFQDAYVLTRQVRFMELKKS